MFRIIDKQDEYFFKGQTFNDKEEIRQELINLHKNDYTGITPLETLEVEELLDYGTWEIEEITDRELLKLCLEYLVRLDCQLEQDSPEWYSRAQTIANVNDFYKEIETDKELGDIIENISNIFKRI